MFLYSSVCLLSFFFVILIHQSYSPVYFLWRCFLCLFLKACQQDYELIAVEETENTEYVAAKLNTNLKKSVCALNVLQVRCRNPFHLFDDVQYLDDFVPNLLRLSFEEIIEILFVCYNFSYFHVANVIYKLHTCKCG